ncbi:MAG TPA: ACT domain-containing protein [Lachnospiraceae bacterium]|jgi:ACT domain-containing protein|nr:ACT domain-containing protein [Lachnospiraceae bacterium]
MMKKVIITVVGKDTVGIIARVCTYLAERGINILDISQTIVGGYFNMMMVTDPTGATIPTAQIADELSQLGSEMGLSIRVMNEDIFNAMHRI